MLVILSYNNFENLILIFSKIFILIIKLCLNRFDKMLSSNLVKLDSTRSYITWLDPEFAEQYDYFKFTLEQYNEKSSLN